MQHSQTQTSVAFGPLATNQFQDLLSLSQQLNPQQLLWCSGYLAGAAGAIALPAESPAAQAQPAATLTILYGSQTGTSRALAKEFAAAADSRQLKTRLVSMADFNPKQLKKETHIAVLISTHGEGEPPDDARQLFKFLQATKAPKLDHLEYAVLGLGDSSYPDFCQAAKDLDKRLGELGAKTLFPRVDCDLDYEQAADQWQTELLGWAEQNLKEAARPTAEVVNLPTATGNYTRKNPFAAPLLVSQKITGRDSAKDIRHIELDLTDSGISYQPGDALGIWFNNDPQLVIDLLELLSLDPDSQVQWQGADWALGQLLTEKLELTQCYPAFVTGYAALTEDDSLKALEGEELRQFTQDRQIIDVVRSAQAEISAQQLVDLLRGQTPRMYSIASSQSEVEEEVHLTVAVVRFEVDEQARTGGASGFLQRIEEGTEVKVFVESNDNFRLPSPETDVIMIGPGTGVAPFRAFMQEREQSGADGRNWLFFGNQHFTQDFLYQTEWQVWHKQGLLNKVDLAWSRDQEEKVYVQDKIRAQGPELYQWLQNGAHLYICGDASKMAADVHQALIEVLQEQGQLDQAGAEAYLEQLQQDKRYQKDVY